MKLTEQADSRTTLHKSAPSFEPECSPGDPLSDEIVTSTAARFRRLRPQLRMPRRQHSEPGYKRCAGVQLGVCSDTRVTSDDGHCAGSEHNPILTAGVPCLTHRPLQSNRSPQGYRGVDRLATSSKYAVEQLITGALHRQALSLANA